MNSLCYRPPLMRSLVALVAGLLLLISFAAGAPADAAVSHAAPSAETNSHFDGDTDQVPGCPDSDTVHHHDANCGAHQLAAPAHPVDLSARGAGRSLVAIARHSLPPGHEPGSELEPPQA